MKQGLFHLIQFCAYLMDPQLEIRDLLKWKYSHKYHRYCPRYPHRYHRYHRYP